MAGCFGNHPFDRAMEQQLMRHLKEESKYYCIECNYEHKEEDLEIEDNEDETIEYFICQRCDAKNEIY